jgi:hypothetical protein
MVKVILAFLMSVIVSGCSGSSSIQCYPGPKKEPSELAVIYMDQMNNTAIQAGNDSELDETETGRMLQGAFPKGFTSQHGDKVMVRRLFRVDGGDSTDTAMPRASLVSATLSLEPGQYWMEVRPVDRGEQPYRYSDWHVIECELAAGHVYYLGRVSRYYYQLSTQQSETWAYRIVMVDETDRKIIYRSE